MKNIKNNVFIYNFEGCLMATRETIEELVDRAIDEVLSKQNGPGDDLKKRRPRPFRYLTGEEAQIELENQMQQFSVMKEDLSPKILEDKFCVLGMGDISTIENVLKKHEASRLFKNK
jgi:hypothetical protein